MSREHRRDPRYHVTIAADLILAEDHIIRSHTKDISARGAFVATGEAIANRQLMRVRFVLPPHQTPVVLTMAAVHVAKGRGVGLQLMQMQSVDATRWVHFVRWIRSEHQRSLEVPISFLQEPVASVKETFASRVRLPFKTTDELRRLFVAASKGKGILVPLESPLPIGADLEVVLEHPNTDQTFVIGGKVHSNVDRQGFRGVAVTFVDLTQARLRELYEFTHTSPSITIDVTGSIRMLAQ